MFISYLLVKFKGQLVVGIVDPSGKHFAVGAFFNFRSIVIRDERQNTIFKIKMLPIFENWRRQ